MNQDTRSLRTKGTLFDRQVGMWCSSCGVEDRIIHKNFVMQHLRNARSVSILLNGIFLWMYRSSIECFSNMQFYLQECSNHSTICSPGCMHHSASRNVNRFPWNVFFICIGFFSAGNIPNACLMWTNAGIVMSRRDGLEGGGRLISPLCWQSGCRLVDGWSPNMIEAVCKGVTNLVSVIGTFHISFWCSPPLLPQPADPKALRGSGSTPPGGGGATALASAVSNAAPAGDPKSNVQIQGCAPYNPRVIPRVITRAHPADFCPFRIFCVQYEQKQYGGLGLFLILKKNTIKKFALFWEINILPPSSFVQHIYWRIWNAPCIKIIPQWYPFCNRTDRVCTPHTTFAAQRRICISHAKHDSGAEGGCLGGGGSLFLCLG